MCLSFRKTTVWAAFSVECSRSSGFGNCCQSLWASQVMLVVKNPPAKAEDKRDTGLFWPLGLGRSPGGGHGNILAWRIPWTEEPGRLWSIVSQRVGHNGSNWALTCMHCLCWLCPLSLLYLLCSSVLAQHGKAKVQGIVPSATWVSFHSR